MRPRSGRCGHVVRKSQVPREARGICISGLPVATARPPPALKNADPRTALLRFMGRQIGACPAFGQDARKPRADRGQNMGGDAVVAEFPEMHAVLMADSALAPAGSQELLDEGAFVVGGERRDVEERG